MTEPLVHIEIPHFANHALFEGAVAWDACGCVANEVALAALSGRTPDAGLAAAARRRDLAASRFTIGSGQALSDIAWDLEQRGCHDLQQIGYTDAPDLNALHDFIKRAALAQIPVIIELRHASALPDNEAGVNYHFVVLGGIDSTLGYLVANGDTRTGIAHQALYGHFPGCGNLPTNWATWQTLEAAGICGAIALKPVPPLPPSPAPVESAPVAPPQAAQALALVAQASQVLASVANASAALQALSAAEAAIKAL